ncbi:uncharacterized protein LOC144738876, partial [Lampetra planeri]
PKASKNITEIIPYKVLKTEYKPFEAKRRLLGNFDMFLSDDRVRRLLPSQLGRHFYEGKKPLSVKLLSKDLARDIERIIQGTKVKVTNKGCCCMARVANSTMTADEVTENIEATVKTFMAKVNMVRPVIKIIHVKSQKSVALPIYTSNLSHLTLLDAAQRAANATESAKEMTDDVKQTQTSAEAEKDKKVVGKKNKKKKQKAGVEKEVEEEEEIPQLVPIETPSKKPKLEAPKKRPLKKAPQPPAGKKATKAPNKLAKKAVRADSKPLKELNLSSDTSVPLHGLRLPVLYLGLIFVVVGLVWIPVLEEKRRHGRDVDFMSAW